jgi:hypothetical protein
MQKKAINLACSGGELLVESWTGKVWLEGVTLPHGKGLRDGIDVFRQNFSAKWPTYQKHFGKEKRH